MVVSLVKRPAPAVLFDRQGDYTRASDRKLAIQFILDALTIDPEILSPDGRNRLESIQAAQTSDDVEAWLLADVSLTNLVHQVEHYSLGDDIEVEWHKGSGYKITRIPPA